MRLILIILAAILFGLDAFKVSVPFLSCTPAAFCCLTVALLLV